MFLVVTGMMVLSWGMGARSSVERRSVEVYLVLRGIGLNVEMVAAASSSEESSLW